jgi:tRNA U34 5-methylaminomethyl-2-thiouridine-forming methyltransferase MnmC
VDKNLQIFITDDGSKSIHLPDINENYHSNFGAWAESEHIYINSGLCYLADKTTDISILEIGFGTGLNAFQTILFAEDLKINYTALEPFPISLEIIKELNYGNFIKDRNAIFLKLHELSWNEKHSLTSNFCFSKNEVKIQYYNTDKLFNLVYFDAFAPEKQPEMWEKQVLEKVYKLMEKGGVLVTYCAKGTVKRMLKEVGFEIEKLPGPKGKREIIRAIKI